MAILILGGGGGLPFFSFFLVQAFREGRIWYQGSYEYRAKSPAWFWIIVGLYALMAFGSSLVLVGGIFRWWI